MRQRNIFICALVAGLAWEFTRSETRGNETYRVPARYFQEMLAESRETEDDEPEPRVRPLAPDPHPFTIEPGRFSFEYQPLNYARNREAGVRTRSWNMPLVLKVGLLHNLDFHLGFEPTFHESELDEVLGTRTTSSEFGDVLLRSKYNLWGNDGDTRTALALMPYVALPTSSHDGLRLTEGGLAVPFALFPWEGLDIEWTPAFAAVRGQEINSRVFEFSSQLVFNQELTEGVIGFFEFKSVLTSEQGQGWEGILGAGLTFELNDDFVIEPAVHFGITSAADDLVLSLNVVKRF